MKKKKTVTNEPSFCVYSLFFSISLLVFPTFQKKKNPTHREYNFPIIFYIQVNHDYPSYLKKKT